MSSIPNLRPKAQVLPYPDDVSPADARAHFEHRVAFETDPSDVAHDLDSGVARFVLLDVRSGDAFRTCHAEGAVHLPHARIREETTRHLDRAVPIVVYCWGPGCNAAAKAAARLAALGFQVREMLGGLEYWRREGRPVAGDDPESAPLVGH